MTKGSTVEVAWEQGWGRDEGEGEIRKRQEEAFHHDGYVHYLDCGGGFIGV